MESEIHNSMHCKSRRCEGCRCPRARKLRSINLQIAEAMAEILRILADCPTREESRPSWFQEKQSEQELPNIECCVAEDLSYNQAFQVPAQEISQACPQQVYWNKPQRSRD